MAFQHTRTHFPLFAFSSPYSLTILPSLLILPHGVCLPKKQDRTGRENLKRTDRTGTLGLWVPLFVSVQAWDTFGHVCSFICMPSCLLPYACYSTAPCCVHEKAPACHCPCQHTHKTSWLCKRLCVLLILFFCAFPIICAGVLGRHSDCCGCNSTLPPPSHHSACPKDACCYLLTCALIDS